MMPDPLLDAVLQYAGLIASVAIGLLLMLLGRLHKDIAALRESMTNQFDKLTDDLNDFRFHVAEHYIRERRFAVEDDFPKPGRREDDSEDKT